MRVENVYPQKEKSFPFLLSNLDEKIIGEVLLDAVTHYATTTYVIQALKVSGMAHPLRAWLANGMPKKAK